MKNGLNGASTTVKLIAGMLTILAVVVSVSYATVKFVLTASSNVDSLARSDIEIIQEGIKDSVAELEKKDIILEEHIISQAEQTQTKLDNLEKLMDTKVQNLQDAIKEQRTEQRENTKKIMDILIEIQKNGHK